jgi:hypothetical protein
MNHRSTTDQIERTTSCRLCVVRDRIIRPSQHAKWERANVHVKNVFVVESVFERHGLLLEIERLFKLFAGTVFNVAF